jgi:Holliday junction DNA helicase RuvA
MIASLTGVLEHKEGSSAVINVGGVGFLCQMSTSSLIALGRVGSVVRAETLLLIKNEIPVLYGFASSEERKLFESLTSVSGVGAKYALAILSTYSPAELTGILQASDTTRLSAVSGIGKKTAQRIILELQGSLDLLAGITGVEAFAPDSVEAEAALALEAMGFSPPEIARAFAGGADEAPLDHAATASDLIRQALKKLG